MVHGANDASAAHGAARILKSGVTGNCYAPFGGGAGVGDRPSDHNLARLYDYSGKLYKVYVWLLVKPSFSANWAEATFSAIQSQ
jgi:hypothetical protein